MAPDKPLTSGRARRALKMGGLASQVGSNYLWATLRRPFQDTAQRDQSLLATHVKNARLIVESSQELRGAFLKIIQMLSMREDILPAAALEVLSTTQHSVPPMDYKIIAEQIRRELGQGPEQLFRRFERTAFAAASLGQVHRATLANGQQVVVKIQYPGVRETVAQDLKNLKLLLATFKALAHDLMRQKLEVRTIYAELQARIQEELDYRLEAANTARFKQLLADDPDITIPTVIPALSSERVLTMTYLEGYPLADVLAPGVDSALKEWVARKYFSLMWRQILELGVLHTDPHPGNYLVTYHPTLGMLDFGSIRSFPEPIRRANLKLARGLIDDDTSAMGQALIALGYLARGQEPAPMVEIVRTLFEPVREDRRFDPKKYDSVAKAAAVGEIALANRLYASPAHSVFLLRALIGAEGIIRQLGLVTNYHRLFRDCVERAEARSKE
ncbi:MAG TPA: AarF/ABC1/UbiB kinase family protein [Candidatus Binataceae bacterium]|nr:AarF/ABC1/UbiB kinase family protein [Candidatus Binataceae bacterium]